jgi:hypothetical protein
MRIPLAAALSSCSFLTRLQGPTPFCTEAMGGAHSNQRAAAFKLIPKNDLQFRYTRNI